MAAPDQGLANTFPIRTIEQLLEELQASFPSLGIREDDFRRPKKERWEQIFIQIVSTVHQINPDNLRYVSPNLNCPELQSQPRILFNLTLAMERMLRGMGIDGGGDDPFCLGDILHPTRKRLVKICSAVVNFVPFQNERYERLEEIRLEKQAEIEERMKYQKRIEELQQKINAHNRRKGERQSDIDKVTSALEEKKEYCDMLLSTSSMLKKKLDERKAGNAGFRMQISNLRSKVALAKEENNRLANMIVPSPNRIKAEMDHRKKQLQDLINSKNEKIIRLEEVDSRRQLNKETQEECESALKIINNFKQNVELEKLSQQEIADIQQKAAVTRDQLWEVEQELQQMARMKLTRAEKMDKMKLQMGERLADKKMEIEQSSREIEHLQLSLSDDHAKRSATREGMKRLEAEERKNVELYTQQMQLLQSKYKELQQALDSYHVRLSAGCRDMLDKIQ